jgi:hypothetical protein
MSIVKECLPLLTVVVRCVHKVEVEGEVRNKAPPLCLAYIARSTPNKSLGLS